MYDVFISYRREGGFATARLIYEHLKQLGVNVFFDLEELRSGQFDVKLYDAIENSAYFALVLSKNSLERCANEGDWLRIEITHAIKHKKTIIPIMLEEFSWPKEILEELKALEHFNGIRMSKEYFDASIQKLIGLMKNVSLPTKATAEANTSYQREGNAYIFSNDKKEIRRLKIQQELMNEFDLDVYKKVCDRYDELRVLDIGSNTGDFVADRILKSGKVAKLIGLEYDNGFVEASNSKYAVDNRIKFFQQNVEDEDFAEKLEQYMDEMGVEEFNVVNISMLILHLKSPYKMLKSIRRFLERGATLIIKDIDDGFNIAYPDEDGSIQRIYNICKKSRTSGYRNSGRQIYTLLMRSGYKNVVFEKMGISTPGMDYEQRAALFDTYFSFILEELKIYVNEHPEDNRAAKDLEWYDSVYENLEAKFQDNNFFFNLGFVMFTANR